MLAFSRLDNITERINAHIVPAIIGGLAGIGGAVGKYAAQRGAAGRAEARQDEALGYLNKLPEYKYIAGSNPLLEQLPEELQAQMIAEDPTLRTTEIAALQHMQELADKGMSAQDAYNYMQATQRAGTESRGQQEAIIAEMQRKGASGSGLEYALRSRAAQGAVDQFAEQQALEAAKKAELQALANMQQQEMAGNIRGEDYRTNSANTNALNEFAQQNLRNKMVTQGSNIDRQNQFAQNELNQQRAVQQGNVELARNNAQQKANIKTGQAAYDLAGGIAKGNVIGDAATTVGKAAGSIWDYYNKPKKAVA